MWRYSRVICSTGVCHDYHRWIQSVSILNGEESSTYIAYSLTRTINNARRNIGMGNFFLETRLCDERKAREKIFISSSSILMYPISKLYTKLVKNYEELRTRVSLDNRSEIKSNSKDPFFRLPSINRLQCVFLCNVIRHSSPFYCSIRARGINSSLPFPSAPSIVHSSLIRFSFVSS